MGLLNSLLDVARKAVSEAIKQSQEQAQQQPRPQSTPAPAPAAYEPARPVVTDWNAYFAEILRTEFPQYGVVENVPVTDLAGFDTEMAKLYKKRPMQAYKAEWGAPYTFVLYANGGPAGIVMLGSGHSHDQNVKYLIARMYAKKLGLPYINFYTQMPNERDYVIGRIRRFMNT